MVDLNMRLIPQDETDGIFVSILAIVERMAQIITAQDERISALTDTVYAIAPELEIIETMAEDDAERTELIERYMNHNHDYLT